jgi:predicted AAA+ superfamily ATPase
MTDLNAIVTELQRLNRLLHDALPTPAPVTDLQAGLAFRWRTHPHGGYLETISDLSPIQLHDLQGIDRQKNEIHRNTEQFVRGFTANNVLLTGSRGTGKSSLIKALLNAFSAQGLRVVEVDKHLLHELPDIVALLRTRVERFIIYCDDLSFSEDDASYRALKSILDGSMHSGSDNVIIYATSNRRHLLPEYLHENTASSIGPTGEIHPAEAIEEKVSLSDRFGLWLTFYPATQDDYVDMAAHWVRHYALPFTHETRVAALQWAMTRGNRSGRTASQFARDWAGRQQLAQSR